MIGFDEMSAKRFEAALAEYVKEDTVLHKELFSSMRYSLLAGGKRLRPYLVYEFCRINGGTFEEALPFACAIEMIHTYSLIHDDLPSMDNDTLRRGKPTNHMVFREGISIIAADALQAMAFEIMLSPDTIAKVGYEKAAKAAHVLALRAGARGMCGGQAIDLNFEGKSISKEILEEMDNEKTGALIIAAAQMGCILGGADEDKMLRATEYASKIGLVFQMIDDILDEEGSEQELGKSSSDSENGKSTYVTLLGIENVRKAVTELSKQAENSLSIFGDKAENLIRLSQELSKRKF